MMISVGRYNKRKNIRTKTNYYSISLLEIENQDDMREQKNK